MGRDEKNRDRIEEHKELVGTTQQKKVLESKAMNAEAIHDALILEGQEEIHRTWSALAWSGLASGLTMGISMLAEAALQAHLPDTNWRPLVSKIGYSFGFAVVTLGRQQLYTETTLTAYLPWAHDKKRETLLLAARLWIIVLVSNLIGTLLFSLAALYAPVFAPDLQRAFEQIGKEATRNEFWPALIKGIYGGWLIALMTWLLPSAQNTRLLIIVLMTWLLAISGLTHIIAGSVEAFYLVCSGQMTFSSYILHYFIPVLTGNTIGGIALVAALNHAQVHSGKMQ